MAKRRINKRIIEQHNEERLVLIGNLLREYRFLSGLSRVDFSKKYGIPRITIQNIESGKNITLETLFRYCDAFSCPVKEIMDIIN